MNQNIKKLGILIICLLAVLVFYLSYLNVVKGPVLAVNPHNRRLQEYESQIRRGTIYDSNGIVLAATDFSGEKNKRVYPRGRETAHLLGYISERYGRDGLESACDRYLLGLEGADRTRNYINKLLGREQLGGDITLTIDSDLQGLALNMLAGRRGAVVLLDPETGAVRVLVSNPGYDPNKLGEIWPRLSQDEDAPLLNRAVQGAYPPGSTFKIVTAAGALAAKPDAARETFNCRGFLEVDGYRLDDTAVHGRIDIKKAIAVSCNTTFAQLGLDQGAQNFVRTVKAFGIDRDPGIGIPVRPGSMATPEAFIPTELAASAIGQGELLVSPLHMALAAAAIANSGDLMNPYLIETVKDSTGQVLRQEEARHWLNVTTPQICGIIKDGMVDAVRSGTAAAARVAGVQVAGKTGSAQNPHGQAHAWFIGFAPAERPRLAVAVLVENAGSGGTVAAPIAGQLLSAALNKGY
ncbi:MAG: penicillin-binding transpeptidase domain-containing protein [Desulfotomaculaceae bacterium]|nr:penicillin-binding transpeptidase domain-containing protein [Desulfotomaculaceae bacterium]